jgi:AcrR family transcriptional regulator
MKTTRTYTKRARAEQAQQIRDRILDAVLSVVDEGPLAACTLPAVAERADVSVQTVLRAFAARVTTLGKRLHREWVEAAFADVVGGSDGASRIELVDLLVAATDISAWKLWRRDAGRSRNETVDRMLRLAASVTGHP